MPTFSNQAQLSYNGITANSNIAYGQILEVLAASKTALSDTYASGDRITYIFSIVNSGTTAFSDLTVTDNLGAYSFTTDTTNINSIRTASFPRTKSPAIIIFVACAIPVTSNIVS